MRMFILILLAFAFGTIQAADTVALAKDKRALLSIMVSEKASPTLRATATEFATMLGRLSSAEFKVETGDGSTGIVLGMPADFTKLPFELKFGTGPFEREDYLLRSQPTALCILGATDLAVSHATWDILYRFGHRQFFPGATWEYTPPAADLAIAIDTRESPSFHARRIWYNWGLWGYNNEPYQQWCVRNRMVKGFDLNSGHAYENIIAGNKAEFEKHPEYFALNNGERRTKGGDIKFCISNPDLRKLVANYAVEMVKKNPKLDSVSMDPSDGGNWCECDACTKVGSVSTRVLFLANDVAEAINALGLGPKYVGMYAYNKHSAPPQIKAHPNVIASATTAFIGGGFTFDQVVEGWQKQGVTIGVYDYLSVVDWDWNLPRGGAGSRPEHIRNALTKFHKMGARFYDAESGDCWGPCGLGYYTASRFLWNVKDGEKLDALTEDFLEKCFGSAKEPMREFYRLITSDSQRRSPSDMTGRMYRQLDAARKASTDAAVQARINDLILYARHAELYYAVANGTGKVEDVAKHAYRIRKTMMVHSYGLWARLISQQAALTPNHPLKNETPYTAIEISKFLSEGIAKNQPVEPGFVSVEFSRKLVPAAQKLNLKSGTMGSFPNAAQDYQQHYVWVNEGTNTINLTVAVQKVWANRTPKLSLYSPLEVSLDPVAVDESYKPDGKSNELKLKTGYTGLHRVVTVDGGDYTRTLWPDGLPVTVESGIDTPQVTSQFRGPWSLYFYVPTGTKIIGGWASRIANWAPRISGKLIDPDGNAALDFAKLEDGWFKADVAPGQDGKLWKFENSQGQRLLMTVPPYLARRAEDLLLPQEVIEKDQ